MPRHDRKRGSDWRNAGLVVRWICLALPRCPREKDFYRQQAVRDLAQKTDLLTRKRPGTQLRHVGRFDPGGPWFADGLGQQSRDVIVPATTNALRLVEK